MDPKTYKQILRSIIRAFIETVFFIILSKLSFFIFKQNLFGEEEHYSKLFFYIYHFVSSMLIFFSTSYTFVFYDTEARGNYCGRNAIITSAFWIKIVTSITIFFLLPISFTFDYISGIFLSGIELNNLQNKLYTMLIMIPIIFVLTLMSYRSASHQWKLEKNKRNKKDEKIVKSLMIVAIIYLAASMGIPWLLPFFLTLFYMIKNEYRVFIGILLLIVGIIAGIFVFCYGRAFCKRYSFLKHLNCLCEKHNITISKIRKPYFSIFLNQNGYNFTIEKNGKRYDCKLIAGILKSSPIVFSDKGNGIRQHTIRLFSREMFHFMTRIDFAFHSENRKILIVLPIPTKIYASTQNSNPLLADIGEIIGDYRIYNSSGFLNALERDCL